MAVKDLRGTDNVDRRVIDYRKGLTTEKERIFLASHAQLGQLFDWWATDEGNLLIGGKYIMGYV